MNKVIAALKRIRLGQMLMAFMAGVLLFVSTACSNAGTGGPTTGSRQDVPSGMQSETATQVKNNPKPEVSNSAGLKSSAATQGSINPRPEVPGGTATSPSGDVINRFEGGSMNEFSDIDPRAKEAGAAAANKASALIENAERNVIDQTGNVGENTKRILDKKGDNLEQAGKNLRQSTEQAKNRAQSTTEDLVQGTKQAAENVKDTTLNTTKDVTRSANQAAEDAKQTIKANTPDTRELTKSANRAAEDATENTKAAGTNLIDRAQQAIQNSNEFVQDKLNQAAKGTQNTVDKAAQNTLNKTGNAINDAIDID